ncbi:MAG: efflux RND transporter periplasmic adaptor subunit [Pseudomonadota bacterium]
MTEHKNISIIRRHRVSVVIFFMAATLVIGWLAFERDSSMENSPRNRAMAGVTVTAIQVGRREIPVAIPVNGVLVSREEMPLGIELQTARIAQVLVEEGDIVRAGQILVRLNTDLLQTQLHQNQAAAKKADAVIQQQQAILRETKAQFDDAKKNFERANTLRGAGALSIEMMDQRRTYYLAAEARLAATQQALLAAQADLELVEAQRQEIVTRLAQSTLRAPHAGLITERKARVGATVTAGGDPLFRLAKAGEIEFEAEVMESDFTRIPIGAAVEIQISGEHILRQGTVRLLAARIGRDDRLARVRISIRGDTSVLRPGRFSRGMVQLPKIKAIAVPDAAILFEGRDAVVFVVEKDMARRRSVELGLRHANLVEVVSGIEEGEIIVTGAMAFLRDGEPVHALVKNTQKSGG